MSEGGDADDGGRTIIRPRSKRAAVQLGHTLPIGTRLRDYEINGLIGEGGFGIVYLAWDHSLQRRVAVKEYMPASMASRVNGSSAIVVKSERHVDTFRAGLRSFVNEARLLARFDHPSLVKVYRFWEENGTAYMVMPFYEGPTLKTALAELGHVPSESELRAWLRPLLDALSVMHAAQCYHRDIAPDNILLTPSGPLLLDFGAARRVIGDMTHALTVVLKPGYAPIEQYGDVATMAQGAWTDLYALACVVYYAITGKTPTSSVERLMDDRMEPLAVAAAGRYSPAFLHAFDLALAVRPQDRPQNDRQFRDLLDADLPVSPAPLQAPPLSAPSAAAPTSASTPSHAPAPWPTTAGSGAAPFARTEAPAYSTVPGTLTPELRTQLQPRPPEAAPAAAVREPPKVVAVAPVAGVADTIVVPAKRVAPAPRRAVWLGLVVVLLVAVAVAAWLLTPKRSAGPASPPAPASAAVPAPSVPAATTEPSRAPAASSPVAPVATEPPPTVTTSPSPQPPPEPAEVVRSPRPTAVVPPPARPRREPAPMRSEPAGRSEPAPVARPAPTRGNGARCSDILQKASLEPLTADEAAYLRRECR